MRCLAACLTVLLAAPAAHAQLKPEEVAILATATGRVSRQLADYYAKARGIPPFACLSSGRQTRQRHDPRRMGVQGPAGDPRMACRQRAGKQSSLPGNFLGRAVANRPPAGRFTHRHGAEDASGRSAEGGRRDPRRIARSSMAWRPKKSGQTGRLLRKKLRRSSARSWTPPLGRRRSGSGQWGGAWRRNGRKRRSRRFS